MTLSPRDDSRIRHVVIIGAGPAGLMAAQTLAGGGCRVSVYDRMPSPARKFLIAGRGGLNLTHSEPRAPFLARYGAAADWLAPLLDAFPPARLRALAEELGEPTFVGSSGRVFPKSFKASPLLRAWLARLDGLGVVLESRHRWLGWSGGALRFAAPEGEVEVVVDAVLLALGGASWPRLGSDGAWTDILRGQGIEIAALRPANSGVRVGWSETFRARFAGAPLKRIALNLGGMRVRGEAMVDGAGLEGGAVYALSAALREAIARDGSARLHVDLRPDVTEEALAARLTASRKGESMANRLRKAAGLLPVAAGLLREAGPLPAEPAALAARIKALPLAVTGMAGLERAISSAGGVTRAMLDDHLMLKPRPGVFVAGEMLDWEAPTGGYLLQACFATGHAAACGTLAWLGLTVPEAWRGAWACGEGACGERAETAGKWSRDDG
ncbi:TIGR03862 family flavoprotein [Ancylobacter dichloromethanicus]|uniref:NAD(FAD)-utilizing dehydrogenase n=1 Tax=Ancylobacter dichloromethanicus TaxID=518825 RepID=A0A9W6JAU7_9HYPH|nr:TIGR03862 family flavoprotein [Ancylobacter dichloromethanicus]GLK72888.1 NAD(FAD)-utilizing dehydrogenase [Ancylobacter dichloromethanicus]